MPQNKKPLRTVLRRLLRKRRLAYRNSLDPSLREKYSGAIFSRLRQLPEYAAAKTVLLYSPMPGEVALRPPQDTGKLFAYPLCVSETEMIALVPAHDGAWQRGYCGIREPLRECSREIPPEELDLVICPCTVFDRHCNRMGMGGGFYDRYLPKCKNAAVIAVAFEGQKAAFLPRAPWDVPVHKVVTEKRIYCRKNRKTLIHKEKPRS